MTHHELSPPLQVQVRRVHDAREGLKVLASALDKERKKWEAENTHLINLVRHATGTVEAEERALRELALARYQETADKHPAPGVSIRMTHVVDYNWGEAFAWAKVSGMALKLDERAFEKIALVTPIACATVQEIPQAMIARELADALALQPLTNPYEERPVVAPPEAALLRIVDASAAGEAGV